MQVILKIQGKTIAATWSTDLQEFQSTRKICSASELHKIPGDRYYSTSVQKLLEAVNSFEITKTSE